MFPNKKNDTILKFINFDSFFCCCCIQFHIILNIAVGGTNGYFPDQGNRSPKPWKNASPQALTDFWNGRDQWLPGWNLNSNLSNAALVVDSIRVWAL